MGLFMRSPFEGLFNLQRALEASQRSDWLGRGLSSSGSFPSVNAFRQGDDYVVVTELPGLKRDQISIEVHDNRLRISGKKEINYGEGASLHRRERVAGTFDRTLTVPIEVDAERVQASFEDGVLALLLPQAERTKPRTINIS